MKDVQLDMAAELTIAIPNYIPAGTHFSAHAHYDHELVVIQQGHYRSKVSGRERMVGQGDILFYTAGKVHEEWTQDDRSVQTWVCTFAADGFAPDEPVFRHDVHGNILELITRLHHYWYINEVRGGAHAYFDPTLKELIAELKQTPSLDSNVMVDTVRAYIRTHLLDQFTLNELADVAGLSRTHFARQYRILTGRSPMEDVRFIRLEEACRLITTTPLPLHEVAPMVGIANAYHLSRLLRSQMGVGVKDLRRFIEPVP